MALFPTLSSFHPFVTVPELAPPHSFLPFSKPLQFFPQLLFLCTWPSVCLCLSPAACMCVSVQCVFDNITVNFNVPQWVECTLHCSSIRTRLTDSVYTFNNAGQCLTFAGVQHQHTPWLPGVAHVHARTHIDAHMQTFARGPVAHVGC